VLQLVCPSHFVFKTDMVNPMIGMRIFTKDGQFEWMSHARPFAETEIYGVRAAQTLTHFNSFSATQAKQAIILGGFARCRLLASSVTSLVYSLREFCNVLKAQGGYPNHVIEPSLKAWCKQVFGPRSDSVYQAALNPDESLLCDCLFNESLREPYVQFYIGRLNTKTL
jgi:hypothetical protein